MTFCMDGEVGRRMYLKRFAKSPKDCRQFDLQEVESFLLDLKSRMEEFKAAFGYFPDEAELNWKLQDIKALKNTALITYGKKR